MLCLLVTSVLRFVFLPYYWQNYSLLSFQLDTTIAASKAFLSKHFSILRILSISVCNSITDFLPLLYFWDYLGVSNRVLMGFLGVFMRLMEDACSVLSVAKDKLLVTRLKYSNEVITAWKVSKYRVFSDPYFPVFGLNSDQKKLRIWTFFTQWILKSTVFIDAIWITFKISSLILS